MNDAIPSFDMVLFGATGDLSLRKLLPALYARFLAGDFPNDFRLIGVGQRSMSGGEFVAFITEKCKPHVPAKNLTQRSWREFCTHVSYVNMDAHALQGYSTLLEQCRSDATRIFYLATPPTLFVPIGRHLQRAGLINPLSRIVLEKPLGHDLSSARLINLEIKDCFAEHQIFRVDHYLGKEAVQNLLALRFGNVLLEPLWRREWVHSVQITVAETVGVGTRAKFYEGTGALRDVLQNHLLQLLCIIAMEPPFDMSPDAVRDEKLKVLRALKKFDDLAVAQKTVRGQYRQGAIDGDVVPGYLDEPGVAPDSRTETYVAMVAEIDSWRWHGVPFFLRTGKRLGQRRAEILVRFKDVPHPIFAETAGKIIPNHLLMSLQPEEGISLRLMAKKPGDGLQLEPVDLKLNVTEAFKKPRMDAYERLFIDILRGHLTLFMRADELEAAWAWVDPILNRWSTSGDEPRPYSAGSWGPPAASTLLQRWGACWSEEA